MALHTLSRRASEETLHVTSFALHLSMTSSEGKTSHTVINFDIGTIGSLSVCGILPNQHEYTGRKHDTDDACQHMHHPQTLSA